MDCVSACAVRRRRLHGHDFLVMATKAKPLTPQIDAGLQQIDAWLAAFTTFNEERLRSWPDGPLLDKERAAVETLGHAQVTAMREVYLSRRTP